MFSIDIKCCDKCSYIICERDEFDCVIGFIEECKLRKCECHTLIKKIDINKITRRYDEHNFDAGYHAVGDDTFTSLQTITAKINEIINHLNAI